MLDWLTALLHRDWFVGFLSGVAATLLGFGLTIVWDLYKMKREERDRDESVLRALREELGENRIAADRNVGC